MRILEKSGNEILLLALPNEEVSRGDYVLIEDGIQDMKMVVQVYDESYLDWPELVNDMVRDEILNTSAKRIEHDPLEIKTIAYLIRDMKLLRCKIRGVVERDSLISNLSWLPSRVTSKVKKLSIAELFSLAKRDGTRMIPMGIANSGEGFHICAESLDGKLNIITGKKGTGKSHLAKLIVSRLAEYGAYTIIFDLNDEYGGIGWSKDGTPNSIHDKVLCLVPGHSLRFALDYIGLSGMVNMLQHTLDIPGASLREFIRIWELLRTQGSISMSSLGDTIQKWRCNELIKDALFSRYHTMLSSNLFSDDCESSTKFEELSSRLKEGGVIIISLSRLQPLVRKMSVEVVLSKIVELLGRGKIPPIFLFAEEAHLYLRDTYWDDLVTRMRHFGVFTTFITNQPDVIKDCIYRQADNIFIFNFTNDADLESLSRASATDSDTIKSIAKTLPPRVCMVLGKAVNDLPIIVAVRPADMLTLGETNLFFKDEEDGMKVKVCGSISTKV
ncbi:MAG: ATP-binding protein [Nitrososphaerales archaeon]|nr:ATP-binding protein [Nitrososphaerales archaeon]